MKKGLLFGIIVMLIIYSFVGLPPVKAYSNPAAVPLLTLTNFAALAKTLISSPTGPTVLNDGDLGIDSPGECTGFESPCTGTITGTINNGAIQYQNAVALQGQTDATAAVTNIGLRAVDETLTAQLGGLTLEQGVYEVPADTTNLTGDLILNGDADSVFIFHLTSTFITDSGSRILLTGGAQACNVFWKVDSSATFNGTTSMVGTVLAQSSITFPGGGATLAGRAIAQTGAITFNNTTVNNSSCATADEVITITPSPTSTVSNLTSSVSNPTSSGSSSSSSGSSCPPLNDQFVSPLVIESSRISPTSIYLSWGPYSGTDSFNIRYGFSEGNLAYNYDFTGFSTTISDLPANLPIWVQIAARNSCAVGEYGPTSLIGGPRLPGTGNEPFKNNYIIIGIFIALLSFGVKYGFLHKHKEL